MHPYRHPHSNDGSIVYVALILWYFGFGTRMGFEQLVGGNFDNNEALYHSIFSNE